ncbi:MAG: dienelactone hydrolase family protein [Chitinophagales bacterium]
MKIQNAFPLLVFFLLISFSAQAQKPCCAHGAKKKCDKTDASAKFVAMSEDAAFSEAHTEPESLPEDTEYIGELKLINVPDGEDARIYEIKSAYKTNRYLFVFHEWWGLNDHIKSESDRWFKNLRDVNVIAIDLYDGKWTKDREKAAELMQSNDSERSLEIIRAAIDYVGKNATIGTIGWCFGGGWSLQAAIEAGDKAAACVVYYGMPEEDTARLSKLEADVLGIFASQDDWINEEVVSTFEQNMEELDKKLTVEWYDAAHAFANPSNPDYDKEAAKAARTQAFDFLTKAYYLKE